MVRIMSFEARRTLLGIWWDPGSGHLGSGHFGGNHLVSGHLGGGHLGDHLGEHLTKHLGIVLIYFDVILIPLSPSGEHAGWSGSYTHCGYHSDSATVQVGFSF